MFELLGICLALAIFLAVNTFAVCVATFIWRLAARWTDRWSSRTRAEVIFAFRLAPPLIGLMFVILFFVPAYISFEPRTNAETVSAKLAVFAILSGFGLMFASWRAARAVLATRALRRQWISASREVKLPGIDVPTFRMPHTFPIIAVIGMFRPRLFIADHVFQSLTTEELAAGIAHEHGHLKARDNIKRGLLRACRDALIVPFGSSLDRAWAEAAESAADEYAGETSPNVALNLASALVTIARMVPAGARPALPLAAFLVGAETRGIKTRVRRLLEIASAGRASAKSSLPFMRALPFLALALALVLSVVLVTNSQILFRVHLLVERVVYLLS